MDGVVYTGIGYGSILPKIEKKKRLRAERTCTYHISSQSYDMHDGGRLNLGGVVKKRTHKLIRNNHSSRTKPSLTGEKVS